MKKLPLILLSCLLTLALVTSSQAETTETGLIIRGQVVDAETGNPIGDVNITVIQEEQAGAATDLAGRFTLEIPDVGEAFTLKVSHINYRGIEVEAPQDGAALKIELEPRSLRLSDVVVTTGRGIAGETPRTISNLNHKTVELVYGAQDVPQLVAETPNVVAFSWSGSIVGASQMSVRGFDTERLSVTVDGVPINDPEDHFVYWQDTPDFLSNAYDIQIERGVSGYTGGPAGIAGGLNLATIGAVSKPETRITFQAGTFNTVRRSVLIRTGIIKEKLSLTARLSQVSTDGYRDHTASKMWGYFASGTYFGKNQIVRLLAYGGEEEQQAYWWGVDKATLEANRRANYSAWYEDYHEEFFWDPVVGYDGERDYFKQPHYFLNHRWRMGPKAELNQTFFLIQGDGFYEEYKPDRNLWEYNLSDDPDEKRETNLIRRKYVDKTQYGWMPNLTAQINNDMTLGLGLEMRKYTGDHYGRVIWAEEVADPEKDRDWYKWKGNKEYIGGYADLDYQVIDKLNLSGGLQLRKISYSMDQSVMGPFPGYEYDLDWTFVNPRIGATFKLNDQASFYASFAGASREPIDDQLCDADNPYDIPRVDKYKDLWDEQEEEFEEVKPEQMWDAEVGTRLQFSALSIGTNLYAMLFSDEIIQTGFNSATDEAVYDNAPRSQHVGIEIDAVCREQIPGLTVSAAVSYGQAILGDYEIEHVAGLDDDWNPIIETVNLKDNRIARFPDINGNLRVTYTYHIFTGSLHVQHVGKQYMDNREDDEASLDAYTLLNGVLRIQFPNTISGANFDLELRGTNLLDLEYEPYGVVDVEYGVPYYVPAAGRQWLAGITFRM